MISSVKDSVGGHPTHVNGVMHQTKGLRHYKANCNVASFLTARLEICSLSNASPSLSSGFLDIESTFVNKIPGVRQLRPVCYDQQVVFATVLTSAAFRLSVYQLFFRKPVASQAHDVVILYLWPVVSKCNLHLQFSEYMLSYLHQVKH